MEIEQHLQVYLNDKISLVLTPSTIQIIVNSSWGGQSIILSFSEFQEISRTMSMKEICEAMSAYKSTGGKL